MPALVSRGSWFVVPNGVRIEAERGQNAEPHTQGEVDHSGPVVKGHQATEFDKHDEKREQQHIHHAPFTEEFHEVVGDGPMFSADQLKQRQFQKRHHFHQWKDHGKQQHHATDEPIVVQEQFANTVDYAVLATVAQLFDGDNRQKNRRPEQDKRRASKSSATHRSRRITALESTMAPGTACAMAGFQRGNGNYKAAGVAGVGHSETIASMLSNPNSKPISTICLK